YGEAEPRAFSNHMTRLRCDPRLLEPRFCATFLHYLWQQGHFSNVCNNHVSQASISRAVLLDTEVLLPPLAEQRRIVAKVEALLAQVNLASERLERMPAILRRFRQSVLAAACSGRLVNDRETGDEAEGALDFLPTLPNGWQWLTAETVCTDVVDCHNKTAP